MACIPKNNWPLSIQFVFSQSQTVLTVKSKCGKSPLELANVFNRPMLAERMQRAIAQSSNAEPHT